MLDIVLLVVAVVVSLMLCLLLLLGIMALVQDIKVYLERTFGRKG